MKQYIFAFFMIITYCLQGQTKIVNYVIDETDQIISEYVLYQERDSAILDFRLFRDLTSLYTTPRYATETGVEITEAQYTETINSKGYDVLVRRGILEKVEKITVINHKQLVDAFTLPLLTGYYNIDKADYPQLRADYTEVVKIGTDSTEAAKEKRSAYEKNIKKVKNKKVKN